MEILTTLNFNGNEASKFVVEKVSSNPTSNLFTGRIIYNTTSKAFFYYNGSKWVEITDINKVNTLINEAKITVDETLSSTSKNPLQNKTIYEELENKSDITHKHSASDITSGTLSKDRLPNIPVSKLDGVIPSSNLPSYVDDCIEGYLSNSNFYTTKNADNTYSDKITGESGKIYVDIDTNKVYRWSGSAYIEISKSIALGETSSTAYRGDRGKTAYDHANSKGSAFTSGLYKITTNNQGHVTDATAVTKEDITALGVPSTDTKYTHPTTAGNKHIPAGGSSGQILRWSSDGTAVWGADNNTTYSNFVKSGSDAKAGLVPAPSTTAGTTKYLREDGTWQVPPDTNTNTFVKQSNSTTTNFRPILLGYNNSTETSNLTTDVTNQAYETSNLYVQPSTGNIYSTGTVTAPTFKGSLTGNASTSSKWATARTITLGTGLQGSVSLDGSANVTLNGSLKHCLQYDETSDFASYAWHKFAETTVTAANKDSTITFLVCKTWSTSPTFTGILTAHVRTGSTKIYESGQFRWLVAGSDVTINDFVMVYTNTANTSVKVELWYKQTARYDGWSFTVLKEHSRTGYESVWTLYTSSGHGSANYTTGTGNITSSLVTILNPAKSTSTAYLPLTGGTMTGPIKYNSGSKTSNLFTVLDGDVNGACLAIGATGGLTIIGGGESANALANLAGSTDKLPLNNTTLGPTSEDLILSADGNIHFATNCNTIANRKGAIFNNSLNFYPDTTNTGSIGTSTYKWANVYATTTHSQLDGNVKTTITNPTSATTYSVPFMTNVTSDSYYAMRANNGLTYTSLEGTTSAQGYGMLLLGNSTATGTAGNKRGIVRIYSTSTYHGSINGNTSLTANRTYTIPDADGTIALTSSNITGSSAKWTTARNINGLSVNGSANRVNYGQCSTAAATVAKVVACTGFELITGSEITVKFTVTNTAASPTLNVNSTGAKPIFYRGAAISAGYLAANRTYTFRYDGTNYDLVGDINTNTTYSNFTKATDDAAGKAGLVPAPAAGKQTSFLRGDGTWAVPTNNSVTVTGLSVTTTTNNNLVRPLLFATSTANPNNTINATTSQNGPKQSVATTYTGGANMTSGAYIKTNYWTNSGPYGYTTICAEAFEAIGKGGFNGNLNGNANSANILQTTRKINGVDFNGSIDISIFTLLYSGAGSSTVTLKDDSSNYDMFIVVTDKGTFITKNNYYFHTYTSYPYPAQGGVYGVDCKNLNTYINGTSCSVTTTKYRILGNSSGVTAPSIEEIVTIKEVYGFKLS